MTQQPPPIPKAKPEPLEFKDASLPVQILFIIFFCVVCLSVPIGLIWMCSGIFTSGEPAGDVAVATETAPEVEPAPDTVAATPAVVTPPEKPKTPTFEVIQASSLHHFKYVIEYRYTGPGLPTRDELIRVSDEVERRQPGYDRYFVHFYLPGQIPGEGCFANAHRDPDVVVEINWFMIPERVQEILDFYDLE